MKVVIAIDSYKGCCSSIEAENAAERGFRKAVSDMEIVKFPIADGGEGTEDAVRYALGGEKVFVPVIDPLAREIQSGYSIVQSGGKASAVIEVAAASGLTLINERERDVLGATSYGTGQLIKDALARGCRKIYFGLGGSATNDAGAGMMQALGVKYFDADGTEVDFGNTANAACGGKLGEVARIDISGIDQRIYDTEFIVLSDVKNVLCGEQGASYVFGPQKGASPEQVRLLDANLRHFGSLMEGVLGKPILRVPGSGAAGGIGASAAGFLNGKVCSGIDALLDILEIDKHLADADLVVTGEGRMDYQTAYGKVPVGIAMRAKKAALGRGRELPVAAIVGSTGERFEEVYEHGIDKVYLISEEPIPLEESIRRGTELIENTAERIAKTL